MVTYTEIDDAVLELRRKLQEDGLSSKDIYLAMSPLDWYIGTDRAPAAFLDALVHMTARKKQTVINHLKRGGSCQGVIDKIKKTLGVKTIP